MARNRVQQITRLRCTACDGWGWVPVASLSFAFRGQQLGEENCNRCGGSGTEPGLLQPVKVRRLMKQRPMTMEEFEEAIRKLVDDRSIGFSLDFNNQDFDDYGGYVWLSEEDKGKALTDGRVWTSDLNGDDIVPSLRLAASSLSILLQMLAQYELQTIPPQHRSR